MKKPHIIDFQHTGVAEFGFLDIAEVGNSIPFEINRVFWTHTVPDAALRGFHAHKNTQQVLVVIQGKVLVTTEMPNGEILEFELNSSTQGVYLPPHVWHHMQYFDDAIQMVMCSALYEESDYLRDYQQFKDYYSNV